MDPQLMLCYMATQHHHPKLLARAVLAQRVAGAHAARRAGPAPSAALRRLVATALIRLGERQEPFPDPAPA